MKLKNILMTAAIALTSVASVNAAATYNYGDLVIGFSQTGNSQFYEVDLGSVSSLLSLSAGSTLTYNTLSLTDLNSIFGNGWANDNTVSVGVVAAGSKTAHTAGAAYGTTWVSAPTDTTQYLLSSSQENNAASVAISMLRNATGDQSYNSSSVTVSSNDARAVYGSTGGANSWTSGVAGLESYYSIITTDMSSSNTVSLDLYQMTGGLSSGGAAATKLGTFSLSDAGVVTYEAVPEPSTYALMGLGGLGMLRMFRRRRA